LPGDNIFSLI